MIVRRLPPRSTALAVLLTALVAVGPLSTDMYLPSLPAMTADLATTPAEVQLTLSLFMLGLAFGQLLHGPLSDRYGRRPVLIGGFAVYTLSGLVCVLAPDIDVLLGGRLFQALGGCAGTVLARAILRDIHEPEDAARMLAYMASAMAGAPLVAPTLGGMILEIGDWRVLFWVLVGFGGLAVAAIVALLPETVPRKDPAAIRPLGILINFGTLLRSRRYVGLMATSSFAFGVIFAFISGSSFVFVDLLGLRPWAYGMVFGGAIGGFAVGSSVSGRLVRRFGTDRLIRAGSLMLAGFAVPMVALPLAGHVSIGGLMGPMVGMTIGVGMVMPNCVAAAIAPYPHMAGTASSLVGFVQTLAAAAIGALVGQLYDGTPLPMVLAIGACGVAALVVDATLVRSSRPRSPSSGITP